jgi:hypothetical protein
MAKQRPSLEAFAKAGNLSELPVPTRAEVGQGEVLVELKPQPAVRVRHDRPHTTLYLDKKVQKVIKEIALQYDRKAHDLYIEGINLMLARYGRPTVDELIKK